MCGIIAAFSTSVKVGKGKKAFTLNALDVNKFIINQFQDQHERGTKGFGIITIDGKRNVEVERACEINKFMLDLYNNKSKMIIAHHRQPTSTDNKLDQTHPMLVQNDLLEHIYLVIHNGIISNHKDLKEIHEKMGFFYTTEYVEKNYNYSTNKSNDSEALAIELALFIEGKIPAVRTENTAAFVILQLDKKTAKATKVFFGKNNAGAALRMSKTRGKLHLSSTGEGNEVTPNRLYNFDVKDKRMNLTHVKIPFKNIEKPKTETTSYSRSTPSAFSPKTNMHMSSCDCTECKGKSKNGHLAECQCSECWSEHTIKQSTPLNLPVKQNIQNNLLETPEEPEERKKRSWNDTPGDDDILDEIGPAYADKGYITERCKTFKEELEKLDPNEITHVIDDTLDEELEKITEIATEYKNILLRDHLEKGEMEFYIEQLGRIVETMRALSNIAEMDYQAKGQAEMESEYNSSGFEPGLGFRGKIGFNTERTHSQRNPDNVDEFESGHHRGHSLM